MRGSWVHQLSLLLPSTILLSGLVLWYRHHYIKKKTEYEALKSRKPSFKVLFFPDDATARSLATAAGKPDGQEHGGNLSELMLTLQRAKRSIDVCIFVFSCKEIADLLIKAHRDGVVIRIITDNEQISTSGSQVERLRRAGVQVRHDSTSYFMHHKFAIVDQEVMACGSLNWTLQGVCGNQENVIITDADEVVSPFAAHFEKLWDSYDPEIC